jgi:hypothetical protein
VSTGGDRLFRPVAVGGQAASFRYRALSRERKQEMWDFIGSVPFFIIMGIILIGLVGLLLYLRKQGQDD